ncbi:serine/threonine protein kinase [Thalassoporum mexicanum PCC 7367]|uniref:serine/threonine protein kinase n=1 Tax=Thalassoporum mexicanum TaxID=3457544 RepID=UPI00029FF19D|nr:serine/threonine-protein kinase [Pseudanabaena sp. PCC 7367]AFY69627.1 serine/threonine protein kinase [Pseudanabaena sp. PCC 7367]
MLQSDQILHDRYQLQRQLGHNAGRQTWLAIDLELKEQVVVKLLTFGGDVQWDDLKLFEREAQVLQQLDHPCIPKYRDYFSIDDRALWFGLVQDYIPGNSLKDLLVQGKKFTEAEVKQIAIEILEILTYLHELNPAVLHRDIKPSNIIYGEDQKVYLVDFGAVQDKASAEGKTFTVVGTYGYAPIEQFGGRAVPASDLYALGATLIHLLTGVSPAELPQENLKIKFKNRTSCDRKFAKWIDYLIEPSVEKRVQIARQASDHLLNLNGYLASGFTQERISKPNNSRIIVQRTSGILTIVMPRLKFSIETFGVYSLVLMFLFSWFLSIFFEVLNYTNGALRLFTTVVFWILIAAIFGVVIYKCVSREIIHIRRLGYLIEEDFLGLRMKHSESDYPITSINQQMAMFDHEGDKAKSFIRLKTSEGNHYFGAGLTNAEYIWLEQEIKDFLGLE